VRLSPDPQTAVSAACCSVMSGSLRCVTIHLAAATAPAPSAGWMRVSNAASAAPPILALQQGVPGPSASGRWFQDHHMDLPVIEPAGI
jgi:hypothetical protein